MRVTVEYSVDGVGSALLTRAGMSEVARREAAGWGPLVVEEYAAAYR